MDKLGCFEHLRQVVAAGFNPATDPAMHVHKDHKEGGLLILSGDSKHQMKKDLTIIQKYQEMMVYIFEFGYNLALSPENNVSCSPQFEMVLGVFGG